MKYFSLLALFAVATLGAAAVATVTEANEATSSNTTMTETATVQLPIITAEDLQKLIAENDDLVIIDSRSTDEYAQGHIPNAVLLTASEATPERLAALASTKETPLVFYCGSITCPASAKTAYKAAEAGYSNLNKYAEGFADWKAKNLPIAGEAAVAPVAN